MKSSSTFNFPSLFFWHAAKPLKFQTGQKVFIFVVVIVVIVIIIIITTTTSILLLLLFNSGSVI